MPLQVSGVIYVNTGVGDHGAVTALRASDGTVQWKRQDSDTPDFGPLLVADGLLINNGNSDTAYALKMSDGRQLWRYQVS